MNNQRGFFTAFLLQYGGQMLFGLGVAAILGYGIHRYNEWIREPLKQDIKLWEDSAERNKKEAAALLAKREQENANLAEKWRQYARKSDDEYEAKIAHLRDYRNSAGGVRLSTGCGAGSSVAGQAAAGSTEAPAKPASGSGTGDAAREFVVDESAIATVLEWYAYGLSCHRFVTAP